MAEDKKMSEMTEEECAAYTKTVPAAIIDFRNPSSFDELDDDASDDDGWR